MDKVKIGVLGAGAISGIYFKNLTKVFTEVEIVAVCDLFVQKAKEAAEDCARLLERCPLPEMEEIVQLDQKFIWDNLSPGGCADLLATVLFLINWKEYVLQTQ